MTKLKVELDQVVRAVGTAAERINVALSRCRATIRVAVMDGHIDVLSVTAEPCARPDLPSLAEMVFGEDAVMGIVRIQVEPHPRLTRRERRWAGNWVQAYEARLPEFELLLTGLPEGDVEFGFLGSSVSGIQGLQFDMIAMTAAGRRLQAVMQEMHPTLVGALSYSRQFTDAGMRVLDINPENSIMVLVDHDQIIGCDPMPTIQFRGYMDGHAKGTIQSSTRLFDQWVDEWGCRDQVTPKVKWLIPTGVIKGKRSKHLADLFLIGTNQEFEWGGKECSLPDKVAGFLFGGLEAQAELPEDIKQAVLHVESSMSKDLKKAISMAQSVVDYYRNPGHETWEAAMACVFRCLLWAKERAMSPEQFDEDVDAVQVTIEWANELLGFLGAFPWVTGHRPIMPLDTTPVIRWVLHETKKLVVRAVKKLGTRPRVFVAGRMPASMFSQLKAMTGSSNVVVVPGTDESFTGVLVGNPTRDLPPAVTFIGAELLDLDLAFNEILIPDQLLEHLDRDCDGDILAVVKSESLFKISHYVASTGFWPKKAPSNNGGELTLTGENDCRPNDGSFPTQWVAHAIVHGADQIGITTSALNRLISQAAIESKIPDFFEEAQLCLDLTTRLKKVVKGMFDGRQMTDLFKSIIEVEGNPMLKWFSAPPEKWVQLLPDHIQGPGLTRILQIGTSAFMQGTDDLIPLVQEIGWNAEFRKFWYQQLHGKQLKSLGLKADSVTRQALSKESSGIGLGKNPSECRAIIMAAPVYYQGDSLKVDSSVGVCFRQKSWDKLPWWLWAHFDSMQIAGFGLLEQLVVQSIDSGRGRARVKGFTIDVSIKLEGLKTVKKLTVLSDEDILKEVQNNRPDYVL